MNFTTILEFLGKLGAAVGAFLIYITGQKSAHLEDEAANLKAENGKLIQQMIDEGKVRKRYEKYKDSISPEWPSN